MRPGELDCGRRAQDDGDGNRAPDVLRRAETEHSRHHRGGAQARAGDSARKARSRHHLYM